MVAEHGGEGLDRVTFAVSPLAVETLGQPVLAVETLGESSSRSGWVVETPHTCPRMTMLTMVPRPSTPPAPSPGLLTRMPAGRSTPV